MSKINEMIYDVRESIKDYVDDSETSDRYILYLYGLKRSKYLRNDLNNLQKTIDISILQTLCLELEEVSINECGIDLECDTIIRTKQALPELIELHLKSSIVNVKPTNRISIPFNFVTKERAIHFQNAPFKNNIFVFLDSDNRLYFLSESETLKLIECVTITGIFQNPLELMKFKNCCKCDNNPCFDYENSNYPLQAHHIDNIREEIVQKLIQRTQIPEDKQNNADNDI